MDILKILQIVTGDSSVGRKSLSDDKWFELFEEIGYNSDELSMLLKKIPDLYELLIKKLLDREFTAFFTIDEYFKDHGPDPSYETVHSLDSAELFSPDDVSIFDKNRCREIAQYLVDEYNWYADYGFNLIVFKYKSDYDQLLEDGLVV